MFSVDRFFWTIGSHGNELGLEEEKSPPSVCVVLCRSWNVQLPPPQGKNTRGGTWWVSGCPRSGPYRSTQRLLLRVEHLLSPGFKSIFIPLSGFIRLGGRCSWALSIVQLAMRSHKRYLSGWVRIPFWEKGKASDLTDNRNKRSLRMDLSVLESWDVYGINTVFWTYLFSLILFCDHVTFLSH